MIDTLEQEHQAIEQRLRARRADLEQTARALAAIPARLVDAPTEGDRLAQFAEHGQLEQERVLLLLEVGELERREHLALVSILEDQEQRARAARDLAGEKAREAKEAAQEAASALLRLSNAGYPPEIDGDRDKCTLYRAELQGKERKAWAVSANAGRAARLAGDAWQAAQQALEQALQVPEVQQAHQVHQVYQAQAG